MAQFVANGSHQAIQSFTLRDVFQAEEDVAANEGIGIRLNWVPDDSQMILHVGQALRDGRSQLGQDLVQVSLQDPVLHYREGDGWKGIGALRPDGKTFLLLDGIQVLRRNEERGGARSNQLRASAGAQKESA